MAHSQSIAYSRSRAREEQFNYLSEDDRHFLDTPEPACKLALIGCGIMGLSHIHSAVAEGRGRIAGIFDTHGKSVELALRVCEDLTPGSKPKVYTTLEEAIADSAIDGFIIATPNYTHRQVLDQVLTAKKPVYLEKPMATTLADAAAIVRATRASDAPVMVGLQYRLKANYREAIELVLERQKVGAVKTLGIREHRGPFLDKVGQWNKFAKYSGGTLVEKCCHYFDLFNLFAQSRPRRVFASGGHACAYGDFSYKGETADILDFGNAIIEYDNGVQANFDLCMFSPAHLEELIVCGDGGRLRTSDQQDVTAVDGTRSSLELHRGELYPAYTSKPVYDGVAKGMGHNGADFFSKRLFVDLITGADCAPPTVEEGYWSVVVGAAAEESARTGQPVDVAEFIRSQSAEI